MPLLGLPPELLERVLDILYDDPPSLSACSLTCWALLLVARLRLFRTVKLGTTRQCLRFLSSLETSSEINGGMSNGAFVRVLILPAKMGLERRNRRAALRMDLVKQILRRVPNVETLDMCRFEWYKLSGLACPNGIDVDPRDAVKTIFAFPRLKALLLREIVPHSMSGIPQLVSTFPFLTALQLGWSPGAPHRDFDHAPIDVAFDRQTHVTIRELTIDGWLGPRNALITTTRALLRPPYELELRRLKWRTGLAFNRAYGVGDQEVLGDLFRQSAPTLEAFEFDFNHIGWFLNQDLSGLCSLRTLILPEHVVYFPTVWASILQIIADLTRQSLRDVELEYGPYPRRRSLSGRDLQNLPKRLIELHELCPTVSLTLRRCVPTGSDCLSTLKASHREILRDVLEAGLPITVAYMEVVVPHVEPFPKIVGRTMALGQWRRTWAARNRDQDNLRWPVRSGCFTLSA